MADEPAIPAEAALEWEETLGKHRPAAITPADAHKAETIVSFNITGTDTGAYVRLRMLNGGASLFLNAAVAIQLADTLRRTGIARKWMNADDGSLIVKDPENLVYHGRKS